MTRVPRARRHTGIAPSGIHLLLTYQCNLECEHCFVWGGPKQTGTMTLRQVRNILDQTKDLGTVEWIYFEGGEPFLYHPVLVQGVRRAARMGFRVGIVTNGYWATTVEDAVAWLRPFAGRLQDLSVSRDPYHEAPMLRGFAENAMTAAQSLGIPAGEIHIASPEATDAIASVGQLPRGESCVMFRGRAAATLADRARRRPWTDLTKCPHEDLRHPGRVHVDPLGEVHLCDGLSVGNLFRRPLVELCGTFRPDDDPVVGPLLRGGPAELVRRYDLPHSDGYADACHLCDEARMRLRGRFPEILTPDQMYGVLAQ